MHCAVLPTPIESLLRQVLNILLAGKAPKGLAPFLAGASLTALLKPKAMGWDVRPIAVGEVIWCMAGKGACTLSINKAADYFAPLQFGVACPVGTEKIIHHLRGVTEQHWMDPDFAILTVDMHNAFNLVSRQAVVDLCAAHYCFLMFHGVIPTIKISGTKWESSFQPQECSRETLWALYSFPLSFMQQSKLLWLILSALI